MIEVGEPRPLAGDEVLLEVRAAGVAACRKSPAIHVTLCGRRQPGLDAMLPSRRCGLSGPGAGCSMVFGCRWELAFCNLRQPGKP
jgi:hypothetical protein